MSARVPGASACGVSDMRDKDRRTSAEKTGSALRAAAVLSGAGITMAASVAIGALGGNWLDQRFGTAPWLLVIGFLLGAIGGFVQMARMIAAASR